MTTVFLVAGGALAAALGLTGVFWRTRSLVQELRATREQLSRVRALIAASAAVTATAQQTEEWLALPARTALDALFVWDVLEDRVRFSSRWRALVGLTATEVHRSTEEWWHRIHPSDRAQLDADIAAQLAGTGTLFSSEHRVRHADGSWLRLHWRGSMERTTDGRCARVTGSVRDITTQRHTEERQRREALYDGLTGLPNRALAIDLLKRAMNRARRQGERRFAVLMVNLDRFSSLNDSLGHHAGDAMLRGVAERLATAIRPGDCLARMGGDEFLLLLDAISDASDAEKVADRVKLVLEEPISVLSDELVVTASIGIVLHDPQIDDSMDYLRDADLALRRAKGGGRARYVRFAPEMRDGIRRRVSLEQDLRGAIGRGEFGMMYQPIWSIAGGVVRLLGFEGLIRWNHPVRGTLGPGEFIPIAEESEAIVPLGGWAIERACRDLMAFSVPGDGAPWISVNVAARQLADRSLLTLVEAVLSATNLEAGRLKLEVTENVILHDEVTARETLEKLRGRGVRALMDDFGTGHASLSYLHRLPIATLKIDRYFVGRMDVSVPCLEIVRSTIALARSLDMEVVAEGVEQEAQLAQLQELGCQAVQGFLLAPPLPAEHARALVSALATTSGRCARSVLRELELSAGYLPSGPTPVDGFEVT